MSRGAPDPTRLPAGAEIRRARPEDAEAVARVHVAGWRHAYRGLMPDDYLDGLDWRDRVERRRASLSDGPDAVSTFVALLDGRLVGFAAHGPSRDDDLPHGHPVEEVYAIYLVQEALGRGLGSALLRRCLAAAPPGATVTLWVLVDNARGRRFYERHGFVADGATKTYTVAGRELPEVRYRLDR